MFSISPSTTSLTISLPLRLTALPGGNGGGVGGGVTICLLVPLLPGVRKMGSLSFLKIIPNLEVSLTPLLIHSLSGYVDIFFFFFFFCLFAFSRTAPMAYGDSQARGLIGVVATDSQARGLIGALATGLRLSHSNAESKPHL